MTDQTEPTKDDLMEKARELDIEGRSSMSKDELAAAIAAHEAPAAEPEAPAEPEGTVEPPEGAETPDAPDEPVEDVPAPNGESQTSGEGGATEVISGDVEPEVLTDGNVLPEHRRQVEGV